jgi:uncharacterized protein (DUF488 family)
LIDVRQAPFSRKPGFSKKTLEEELHKKGIEYVGIPELGTDKESRDRHKADGNMAEILKEYRAKVERNIEKYELLKKLAVERTSCIMCYEEDINDRLAASPVNAGRAARRSFISSTIHRPKAVDCLRFQGMS